MRYKQKQLYLMFLNNIVNILCFTAIFIATVALIIFFSDASKLIKKATQNTTYVILPNKTIHNDLQDNEIYGSTVTNNIVTVVPKITETNKYFTPSDNNENNGHVQKTQTTLKFNESTTKKSTIPPVGTTEINENIKPNLNNVNSTQQVIKNEKSTCKMLPQKDDVTKCGDRIADMKCCEYIWAMNYKDDIMEYLKCSMSGFSYGFNDSPAEFPHMAAVGWLVKENHNKNNQFRKDKYEFKCSGSLISNKYVLSSARCIVFNDGIEQLQRIVRFGVEHIDTANDVNVEDRDIEKVIYHPKFSSPQPYHDIALLKFKSPLIFTKKIHPACILTSFSTASLTKVNVTGWEMNVDTKELSGRLQKSTLNMIKRQECLTKLMDNDAYNETWTNLQMHQLCANVENGRNNWQGDSGSPIQVKINTTSGFIHTVVGVTSMTHTRNSTDLSGIYTSVSSALTWIEETVWPEDEKDEFT